MPVKRAARKPRDAEPEEEPARPTPFEQMAETEKKSQAPQPSYPYSPGALPLADAASKGSISIAYFSLGSAIALYRANWKKIIPPFLAVLGISVANFLASIILGFIPCLGSLLNLAVSIIVGIATNIVQFSVYEPINQLIDGRQPSEWSANLEKNKMNGIIYYIFSFIAALIVMIPAFVIIFAGVILSSVLAKATGNSMVGTGALAIAVLAGLAVAFIPLYLLQFTPIFLVLGGKEIIQAAKGSIDLALKNIAAALSYSLLLATAFIAVALAFAILLALLVVVPAALIGGISMSNAIASLASFSLIMIYAVAVSALLLIAFVAVMLFVFQPAALAAHIILWRTLLQKEGISA